jgi:hypothetical protein
VIGGHGGGEVGGGFVLGFVLPAPPFHEQTVGQARKDPVRPHGVAVAQAALVIPPGDVQPGVESVFNAPVLPVALEPAGGRELLRGQAGDQRHVFGRPAIDFPAQAGGLGGEGESGLLGRDGRRANRPGFGAAPIAFVGAGEGC